MLLVQRITERYVCRLFILLLFGCSCCQSQGDLSRKHVYKYFMERMPRDFICEGVPKLADIEHELVHCVIDGIRQAVFVVDPKDIDIEWSPRAETYSSRSGGSIRFFLRLKENEHPFTWLKIRPAEEFGKKSPLIQNASITWEAGVGGCFRYYVVSPFKAIAFTLKITQDFHWHPSGEYAVDTGSAKNVRYIRTPIGTKLKLLHCRMCSGQKSVTILQNYYAKFGAASTPTEDRVECDGEYEGNSTYFSTPISIIRANKLFYEPLFDSAYLKGVSKFPLKLDALIDPGACRVESKTLTSSMNPLLNGIPGRYNVTCGNAEFSQSVLILNSRTFEIFYGEMTVPFAVRLNDLTLKMSDMRRYACFWVTLTKMGKVVLNERVDSSAKNITIHCAAFVGPIEVRATLYHLLYLPTAIKIQLLNDRQQYIIGEHMEDIEVRASIGLIEIPPRDIQCSGKITFQSPFIKISSHTKEGTVEVFCFAMYHEQKSEEKHFRIHFLAQANFRLFTAKLGFVYIVRASYLRKPGIAWIDADPMQIASQICNVNCIGIHGDGTSFISTIRIDEITRYFEVFDCYCNRTYKLMSIKRTVEFSFLLKRGLILLNWEASDEATCIIDTQSEIDILPNDFYQKLVPVVRYRQMQSGCPVLTCKYVTKELEKYSLLYWNWHSRAVEFFSAAPYKRKLSYLECYDFQVKVINFDTLKYPEIIEPPNNVIVPEIQQDLWIYLNDSKGLQTPVYRCYFTEMINPATETGRVILRSYFTHSFSTKLYCERVMNGDPVDISISFVIYPFNKLNVTIEPMVERIFVAKNYNFTCTSTRPELLQAYGSIVMVIYANNSVLATSHGVSITLRANGENEVPQIYSIRCLLYTASQYGELGRRDVIVYGPKLPTPKLKSIHPKAYFHNGDDEVNSHFTFINEKGEQMKELTSSEKPTGNGVEIKVFYQSKQLYSRREVIPTIDIKTIKLQIEGAKKLFLLADRDSEEIIMCHVSGTEPLSGDELQVKWSFSQIFYHPAPPLIDGARIILNDKVGEGAFCAICTIPLLQSSTPTNETCFVVIHAYRFNITLVPKDEDGVYILGSTNILRCSVSINEGLMDLDPQVPTCRLKTLNGSAQNISNGAIRLSSDQRAGPIAVDIIVSLFEMDVIIKPTTVWFIDSALSELQIFNVLHTFDIRWTGTITCALQSEDMTEVFMRHFQWIGTHTNEVVPNSHYNQLFIRNEEEIQGNYTCKFKIGNLKKDLDLKYVDFSKISFSTNANIVYDIYKKGYQIHCYVHPEEAQNYAKFVWGWYDPRKKVYRKFVDVDTFEEGAHHLTCSSPRSSVRPLNITFYVLRANSTHLLFTPPTMARYKRSDALPKCVWSVPWMNEEPGLRPTLIRSGFTSGTIFRGRSGCTFSAPGFHKTAMHVFRIIDSKEPWGLNGVRLQIVQDTRKKFFRFGQKAIFTCTMVPSISEKIFESVLYWRLFDNGSELQQPRIDTSNLQPGKYNSSCWSSSLTFSVSRLFYIIGEKAKLTIENPEKRTYLVGEQMPTCVWNEKWMNDLPELAPNTIISDLLEGRRTIRTITCNFWREDIRERYSGSIIIVKKDDLQLKLSDLYAVVLKEIPTIVCDLDPPIEGIEKPYFYPVQEFGLAQVKGNRIIPGNSNSNSSNGTYICIFDKQNLYMTKIFVISSVDLSTSPMIFPAKREFVSGEQVECSGTKNSQSGYYAMDVFYKDTHIPLVNKKQNRAILISVFVTEITIYCTLRNSYLNTEFGDKNVSLSALVRPKKLIKLKPGHRKYVDTSAVVHCAFDSIPKIGQHVTLNLFIYPLGYRHKVEKISLFSFKEQGVIGGRYFFTCAIVNDDGPLWATIDEIVFLKTPAIPKISEKNIYGDQGLYCWTTEYPIWNRLLIASTESENGEIVRGEKGLYRFSPQSCYGYYNVTCEVYGYYNLIAFHFQATYQVHYTGPEYDARNAVDINNRDIIRICSLLLLVVTILLLVAFLALENHFRHQHLLRITNDYNYGRFQSKLLKRLQGQFLRIDLKDVSTDEALKFMMIVKLFDVAFTQVRPNFKRVAKKAKKTQFTRKHFIHLSRVTINNWISGRYLHRRRKIADSSSEDSLEIIEAEQSVGI